MSLMVEPEALFDLNTGYSPSLLHFAVIHWLELDSRSLKEALAREWQMLPRNESGAPKLLCLCGPNQLLSGTEYGGPPNPSSRTPETIMLDIQLAYAQLPIPWLGRTEVFLLLNGSTPAQINNMKRANGFTTIHRSRLTVDVAMLGPLYPRQQDQDPENQSPWARMAAILSGISSQAA